MNKKEGISATILCLLGLGIWWQSGSFPDLEEGYPGPSLFPRMIAVGLLLSGLWLGFEAFKGSTQKEEAQPGHSALLKLVGGLALVGLYPLLQPLLGFMASLGLICLGIGLLLSVKPWIALVSAVCTVLFIFFTFEILLGVTL